MNNLQKILNNSFLYNPVENWFWFFGILLVGFLFKRIFSVLVSKIAYRLIKQETQNVELVQRKHLVAALLNQIAPDVMYHENQH